MFSMDLGSAESRGHIVVALYGELDLLDAAAAASALRVAAAREPWIIVDLTGLEFIDASGVAALSRGRGYARDAGGDLLLAAPQRLVRRVLAILWEADGFAVHASVAAAAARAQTRRPEVVPIWRQPARKRWQRIAMNVPAPEPRPASGDYLPRGSWASSRRPPTVGGING
jgi:anti-sigma B factor antagonist